MEENSEFIKPKRKEIFGIKVRNSSLLRILLGTSSTTFICFLFNLFMYNAKLRDLSSLKSNCKKYLFLSLSFYTLNEVIFSVAETILVYNSFPITNIISASLLYKPLAKNLFHNKMYFFDAIHESKKKLLYLVSFSMTLEFILYFRKSVLTFSEPDIVDFTEKIINNNMIDKYYIKSFESGKVEFPGFFMLNSKNKRNEFENFKNLSRKAHNDCNYGIDMIEFSLYYHYIQNKKRV